jgi:hypothetical protein
VASFLGERRSAMVIISPGYLTRFAKVDRDPARIGRLHDDDGRHHTT